MSTTEANLTSNNMAVAVLDILGYLDLIDRRGPAHVARVLDTLVIQLGAARPA